MYADTFPAIWTAASEPLKPTFPARRATYTSATRPDIRSLDFTLKGSPGTSRPMRADIKGGRLSLSGGAAVVDTAGLTLEGTGAQHRIRTHAAMTPGRQTVQLDLDASGGINRELTRWKGSIGNPRHRRRINLKLPKPY
ncbi:periplasmic domain protein [Neisseria gonorrhoeae]|nr:periplasmic domain protein [Neisseria gonorrhoeae]